MFSHLLYLGGYPALTCTRHRFRKMLGIAGPAQERVLLKLEGALLPQVAAEALELAVVLHSNASEACIRMVSLVIVSRHRGCKPHLGLLVDLGTSVILRVQYDDSVQSNTPWRGLLLPWP